MRILVTGLTGFTGRHLAAELEAENWSVTGLEADLTDAAAVEAELALKQPDAVVHLAGIAFVGHGDANDFYRVNLMGTRNLLAGLASCRTRPQSVLLASSANVYGNSAAGTLTEDAPLNPVNDYAVSKLAMEYMARLWLDKLPIVIARPFNYTGLGQSLDFVIPKLVDHFARRAPVIELGNLDVEREFNDVRFVAKVYRALVERPQPGRIYNVCTSRPHTLRSVIALLSELTGHHIEVRVNPAFVRAHEVKSLCGDPSRLRAVQGELEHPPLRETLEWMLRGSQADGLA
jgi:GDP-6-deoxy-D-talose 4-dehydrogenase